MRWYISSNRSRLSISGVDERYVGRLSDFACRLLNIKSHYNFVMPAQAGISEGESTLVVPQSEIPAPRLRGDKIRRNDSSKECAAKNRLAQPPPGGFASQLVHILQPVLLSKSFHDPPSQHRNPTRRLFFLAEIEIPPDLDNGF